MKTPGCTRVLEAIAKTPSGATNDDLQGACGMPSAKISDTLAWLRKTGRVRRVGASRTAVWVCTDEQEQAALVILAQQRAETAQQAAQRRANHARVLRGMQATAAFLAQSTHWVPAGGWTASIPATAVVSVWDLGRAAA